MLTIWKLRCVLCDVHWRWNRLGARTQTHSRRYLHQHGRCRSARRLSWLGGQDAGVFVGTAKSRTPHAGVQVISGIGFLGAGTIMKEGRSVRWLHSGNPGAVARRTGHGCRTVCHRDWWISGFYDLAAYVLKMPALRKFLRDRTGMQLEVHVEPRRSQYQQFFLPFV